MLIRERRPEGVPFDIFDLRHIEYENTPNGLKVLAERMSEYFDWVDANPDKPDNRFLELALFTHYEFPWSAKAQQIASIDEKIADVIAEETAQLHGDELRKGDTQLAGYERALKRPEIMGLFLQRMLLKGELFK